MKEAGFRFKAKLMMMGGFRSKPKMTNNDFNRTALFLVSIWLKILSFSENTV